MKNFRFDLELSTDQSEKSSMTSSSTDQSESSIRS